jgi:hypothetical protein
MPEAKGEVKEVQEVKEVKERRLVPSVFGKTR